MRYTTFPLKLGRQCLLYLLSFAVILLVAEGLLRIKANTQHIDDIVYIKRDGLVFMEPNSDQVVSGGNFKPIHVVTNSDGFATPNTTLIPPTGTVRIAFMGNSFTKGFEVDYTKKFTSRVEQLLNETNSGKKLTYEVMNFGNGGYSFVEQLLIYEQYVKKYHPQYVFLITFPPTDFFRNHAFEYKQDYLLSTPIEKITNKELFSDASFLNSTSSTAKIWQLSIFARKISSGIFEKINKIEHGNNTIVKKIITPFNPLLTKWGVINNEISQKDNQYIDETFLYMDPESERAKDTILFSAKLVTKLGTAVEHDGGHFGFIIIPTYWQVDPKYIERITDEQPDHFNLFQWNEFFAETIGKKFPILDLVDLCRRSITDNHIQMFIRDTGHFTPTGHELVGQEIKNFISTKFNIR
jgi:hypothetical protein